MLNEPQLSKIEKVLQELKISSLALPADERAMLIAILEQRLDAFAGGDDDIGRCRSVLHTIDTGSEKPVRQRCRVVPYRLRSYVDNEIDRLLAAGLIARAQPGCCPYASPIVVTGKKDGSYRMCVDYRQLNAQTVKDAYPLPRMDEILVQLNKAKYFIALDLLSGYYQIEVATADRIKTAFITHKGLFVFNVMPFGLCNAPATFQRCMDALFSDFLCVDTLVYLDDILIFAATVKELLIILDRTLSVLTAAGFKCKPRKCSLLMPEMVYLGYRVSRSGLAPDVAKLHRIREWPMPKSGAEVHSFVGLCGYYRTLIPHFAEMSASLYEVVREGAVVLTAEQLKSFADMKEALCSAPILRLPDPDKPFIVETDASAIAIGAVLKQKDGDESEYPVCWYSQSLHSSERNYSTFERELYAVVRSFEFFRVLLPETVLCCGRITAHSSGFSLRR